MRLASLLAGFTCATLTFTSTAQADSYLSDSVASHDPQPAVAEPCESCDCLAEPYECCDCFNDRRRVLGMLPSDHCFDRFISPISNPFFFEDPRSLTEARGIFLDNSLPNTVGSGDAQVWAGQLRGRVTDRLSLIAPRLAYWQVNSAGGGNPRGFMAAPVGFKYNFVRDVERQLLISGGITYFIPATDPNLPPPGSGDFHFYLTGGAQIYDRGHWLSGTGFRIPSNNNWGTQLWYWSNQWDYELPNHIYPLVGLNWYHWMRSANLNAPIPVTGLDLLNLPTGGVAGSNVVTGLAGMKWKPSGHLEVGGGYEFPLTQNRDVLSNRIYFDVILRY
jgi:hypothetical protein